MAQNDGCFCDLCPIPLASITDGLSATLFVMERATSPLLGVDGFGPDRFARHGWYITGNWGDTLVTTFYPPNAWKFVSLALPDAQFNAESSRHPGGLQALMGDGSARFVRESIQSWPFSPITGIPTGARTTSTGGWTSTPTPGVWQALATRSGGEHPGDF